MIIAKLRKPYLQYTSWVPINGWVWLAQIKVSSGYTAPPEYVTLGYPLDIYNTNDVNIGDVFVDGIKYAKQLSFANCEAVENSWYYTGSLMYVHADHTKRMDGSDFDTTEIFGQSSETVFYDENGIEYLPFVNTNLKVVEKVDRLVYNKISFPEQKLKLDNRSGRFDSFYDNPTPGSDMEYLFIPSAEAYKGMTSLTPVYTGYVYDDEISRNDYSVTVKDKRAQLSDTWPKEKFTADDYPDIDDDLIGDTIPAGYGYFDTYIPAIILNGKTITGDVEYKYSSIGASSGTGVLEVEIDGVWTVIAGTFDYPNGEVSTTAVLGRNAAGKPYAARVKNILMYDIVNPLDALVKIMELAGYPYNNELWDTTKVNSENALYMGSTIALYTDKEQQLFDYIEQIQGSGVYGFKLIYGTDSRWTIQCDDIHRAVSAQYDAVDNISDIMPIPRDLTDYATSIEVTYSKNYYSNRERKVLDSSGESEIFNIYRVYQKRPFGSLLRTKANAEAKAANIAEDYAVARGQITFTLNWIQPHLMYDVVQIDTRVYDGEEILREYLGTRKIKISYIEYDFNSETTTIRGYDITEVI